MGDLTKHFDASEFYCQCHYPDCDGKPPAMDLYPLAEVLEILRAKLSAIRGIDTPIHIHCAYRCKKHNHNQHSEDTSQHRLGRAADIHAGSGVDEVPVKLIYKVATQIPSINGFGWYNWGAHVDIRHGEWREWVKRTKKAGAE